MRTRRARTGWLGVAALACAVLLGGNLPLAAAAPETPRSFVGNPYSSELPLPPTRAENQNKLWFHADAWWAMMLEPDGRTVKVYELMPDHTWRPTSAVVNPDAGDTGDAVRDGAAVHTVSRRRDGSLHYTRLVFDAANREYRNETPLIVTTRGANTNATVAEDSKGRLWVAYATVNNVVVTYSDDGGRTWGRKNLLANTTGRTPEVAALVTYDDRVGLLWSDQGAGAFAFASHRDGNDPNRWTRELGPAGQAQADNHISLKRVDGARQDTLVAVAKSSRDDTGDAPDAPLIELLIRRPGGEWSKVTVATVADRLDDAVVQVDDSTDTVHVFASQGGNIVTKSAPVDDLQFPSGLGNLFVLGAGGGLVDPTVTRDPVDDRSGLVVLASDAINRTYRHAEMAVTPRTPVVDPDDTTAPDPPAGLQARTLDKDTVVLTWAPATDGDRWAPAQDGVPVKEYAVLRDGVPLTRLTGTSVQDRPWAEPNTGANPVEYVVRAVDASGNRSAAVSIVVDPPVTGTATATVVGFSLLLLAVLAGIYALWRRRLAQAMTAGRPDRDEPVPARQPAGSVP